MKIKKILIILVLCSLCLYILSYFPTYAYGEIDTSGINVSANTTTEFDKVGSIVFGAIQGIGIGISVIILVIMGIKYMLASLEERAEYKSKMLIYILGVVFLAGATTIPNLIYKFAITIK